MVLLMGKGVQSLFSPKNISNLTKMNTILKIIEIFGKY